MMSLKSMERRYCCLTELESKGLFSTCSKFIMNLSESLDVFLVYEIVFLSSDFTNTYFSFLDHFL
jgi:hypothetical protein